MIYRRVFELPRRRYLCPIESFRESLGLMDRIHLTCVHTEILRTSRQIHDEAAPELYSELTIVLCSGNNLAGGIPLTPIDEQNPWKVYDKVWRHSPFLGARHRSSDGRMSMTRPKWRV